MRAVFTDGKAAAHTVRGQVLRPPAVLRKLPLRVQLPSAEAQSACMGASYRCRRQRHGTRSRSCQASGDDGRPSHSPITCDPLLGDPRREEPQR
jgi:hypothetical protein